MVAEIKGFNENLETLFPDVKIKAAEAMRQDIGRSDQIQDLRLLQEATAGEYEDISESASVRLETLGATVTDISDIVSLDDDTVIWGESDEEDDSGWAVGQGEGEEVREIPRPREKEIVQLSKRLHGAVLFETMKNLGALRVSLRKPDDALGRAFTHLSWDGYPPVETWDPEDSCWAYKMTVLGTPHPSFGKQTFLFQVQLDYMLSKACRTISQKKFIHRQHMRAEFAMSTEEDYVFFDIESDPEYQSAYYGTVTCDGFGLECWDYEVLFGKQRDMDVLVIYNDLPALPDGSKILRRLDELCQDTSQVGLSNSNSWHDMTDLEEFTGELALAATKGIVPTSFVVADLCSLLSNQNVIADFTTTASGAEEWRAPTDRSIGLWNFLRQMIITNELARRLSCDAEGQVRGFTTKVLASLIIADRWFQNVQIRLVDTSVDTSSIPKTVSSLQKPKAEDFKRQGNEATRKKLHQRAVELYTEAVKADSGNVVYRNNRSGALYDLGKNQEALDDALIATKLDPTYAKAWARLGLAHLRLGRGKRAKEALQRAIELAGRNVTDTMRQGLEDANAKIEADMNAIAIEQEKNKKGARRLHVAFLDEDWDLTGRTVAMDSRVYARQTEGLVLFAERMRWPYLEEVGNYAETVYGDLVGGQTIPSHLHDWMYGMMLPGKWFAFKIMSALIICSRSIRRKIGLAPYYDCGDLLPQASYWRVRTPLGSILGCLPGARSLNGWLGPCPPVRFISTLDADKPRHIRVHA
jgi:tetratricopeptide (TPR) repeat protein